MRKARLAAIAAVAPLLLTPAAWGYIRLTFFYGDGSSAQMKRSDAIGSGTQFYLNNSIVAGYQTSAGGASVKVISSGSNPLLAARAAIATWNASGAAIKFLALQGTTAVINSTDGQNTIAFGSTASDLSVLGFKAGVTPGAIAVTVNTPASFTQGSSATGDVTDSDVVLNPSVAFSTDFSTVTDLQAVLTHEFGHALGLDHSGLLGATMFQFSQLNQRYLTQDELSFAAAVYPAKQGTLGTISGKLVAVDGSAVQNALVELLDTANGNSISALTASDGTYSLQIPAGSYTVTAEPMGANTVVSAGYLYLPATAVVTTNFQPSVLGGVNSPTQVSVATGAATSIPNFTVTAGTSALQIPYAGIGKAGASGDIVNVVSATPIVVPSGQSVDIGIIGGGVDATTTVQVIGQGISVVAGSTRVDSRISFGGSLAGSSMIRTTLTIAAKQVPSLASVILTKGSSTLTLSGVLVLVPPTPTFGASSVESATYAYPGSVSPGGLYSVYDLVGSSLGPAAPLQPTSFDLYGNLGTSLGGVSVTFDNVPAPLTFVYNTQVNFQAPFELVGKKSTQMVVNFYGSASAPVAVPVVPVEPAFFVYGSNSTVIAQNFPDYSLNASTNAIARGGYVVLYGTGLGQLSYSLATGQQGIVPPASYASTYSCSFGGQTASAFSYWNYGAVGLATWVVAVPASSPTGAVVVTCTDSASGASTPQGTIYVK